MCVDRILQEDQGEDPSVSALLLASCNGHDEAVRVLMAAGADVTARDEVRSVYVLPPTAHRL